MSYNANHYDARADEDIVDVLTAISVVSKIIKAMIAKAFPSKNFRKNCRSST